MRTYSEEFKAQIVAQILPPHNRGIPELVKETGIPKDTLYTWRSKHRGMQEAATPQGKGAVGLPVQRSFNGW
jgi:transposase